jgi:hypothetical protein
MWSVHKMEKFKKKLRNNRGQILVEALVASTLMILVMLAFAKLIELKKQQPQPFKKVYFKLNDLNQSHFQEHL